MLVVLGEAEFSGEGVGRRVDRVAHRSVHHHFVFLDDSFFDGERLDPVEFARVLV